MSSVVQPQQVAETRSAKQPRRKTVSSRARRENLVGYLFMLPWFVGLIALTLGPMLGSLYLSFTSYDLLSAPRWIGLQNYGAMLADIRFLDALKVTAIYVLLSVPLKLIFALLVAMVLNRGLRGLAIYRSIYYVPSLLGGSVTIAILWQQIFGKDGIVNAGLALLGFHNLGSWVANPNTSLLTLIVLAVWQFGSPMLIFLAGLKQIPQEMYEAANIDGAGVWKRFFRITLPMLSPIIFFNLVLQMISAFQAFTPAFIVSNGNGGPYDSTLFYTLYIYLQGFGYFHMGYASAMAWVLLLIIAIFTAVAFRSSRLWVFYQDEK
ncbi:carbohydrate ABC transporter permease [Dictyobacter aurantiacus]|uniref:Sugar ABC transporter permease n=1 Tax=Dictyobacter aurantiacus TaxID=1936993 RepID=A0A401ZK92_9CHLR|nr:sugar ABC transporter permease [Dictyobacter aurantiacus]GCE07275.1 sugar ABC transporter permease [Dictyobacter aurantiacus]